MNNQEKLRFHYAFALTAMKIQIWEALAENGEKTVNQLDRLLHQPKSELMLRALTEMTREGLIQRHVERMQRNKSIAVYSIAP
jgi:predicted transcriptional regulator